MLLSKTIKLKIVSNQCKRYKELGYEFKCNDIIEVRVEDLPMQSNQKVLVKCDVCGKEYYLQYCDFTKKSGITICKDCTAARVDKSKQTCMEKYGVDNPFKSEKIREKQKQTVLNKYGCENVFQNNDIKEKSRKTMINKYGKSHPMHVDSIKQMVIDKSSKTMMLNQTQKASKNQIYLCNLYNGCLNYLYDKLWLDIFFENEKIYCEYDGSGHDIDIKYHKISEEDFKLKEIRRYKFLSSKGLKEFRIISRKDILPNKDILISMKNFAFYILNNKISNYIIFDIDNQIIKFYNNAIKYDYIKNIDFVNSYCNDCWGLHLVTDEDTVWTI